MSALIAPPILTSRIIVVSDFNCPYCYTLNEWIADLGAGSKVRWLGIEHRPTLPKSGQSNLPDELELLQVEVADVQERAPDVGARLPTMWCNSRDAVLFQNSAEVENPDEAAAIRQRLFRGYWNQGIALDSEQVLGEEQSRFPHVVAGQSSEELEEFTVWWKTQVDRIPAMIAPTGHAHLGLQDRAKVARFLNSTLGESTSGPGCR